LVLDDVGYQTNIVASARKNQIWSHRLSTYYVEYLFLKAWSKLPTAHGKKYDFYMPPMLKFIWLGRNGYRQSLNV
jgi:hypothetical protein